MRSRVNPDDLQPVTPAERKAYLDHPPTPAEKARYLARIRALEEAIAAIDPDDPVLDRGCTT